MPDIRIWNIKTSPQSSKTKYMIQIPIDKSSGDNNKVPQGLLNIKKVE